MIHRVGTSTNRILFGLTSCVVVLTYIAYKISETKVSEKSNKDGNKNVSSDVMKNLKPTNGPMFNYSDETLTKTVLDMASQRAKRWMSFRSTGVQYMVGQVGGKSANKRPILIFESYVLKPANADHRGIREVAFYEAIQATHGRNKRNGYEMYCTLFGPNHEIRDESTSFLSLLSGQKNLSCFTKKNTKQQQVVRTEASCDKSEVENETKLLHRLELFTARYIGTVQHTQKSSPTEEKQSEPYGLESKYIILNNLTSPFSKPCVLDLKIGTETFEPDATDDKIKREMEKYPQQAEFGFRMVAMRLYDPQKSNADEEGFVYYPKQFGRSLSTRESVKDALLLFLGGTDVPESLKARRSKAIKVILSKLKLIRGWFRDNNVFAFSGSSILVIYEGETERNLDEGIDRSRARVKMIDFGRVRRQIGGDPSYRKGLEVLSGIFEEILTESFWIDEYKYLE